MCHPYAWIRFAATPNSAPKSLYKDNMGIRDIWSGTTKEAITVANNKSLPKNSSRLMSMQKMSKLLKVLKLKEWLLQTYL